jgi:pimeloyl-ACP methyl ester carboxylesterase
MPPPPEFFDDPKSGADALIAMYTFYGSGPQAGSDPAVSRREWKEFLGSNMKSTPDGRWTWRWDQRLLTPAPPQPAGTPQLSYEEQAALRWKEFAQIDCPVLVVRGELSGRIAHETVTLMAERFPNVRVVEIPKAGHVVPLDEPRGLLDALAEFLAASRSS